MHGRNFSGRMDSNPGKKMSSPGNLGRGGGRKIKNVVSAADHAAMHEHYSFLPPESNTKSKKRSNRHVDGDGEVDGNNLEKRTRPGESIWQERMVVKYHEHLFKEFALADLSVPGRIGLRWRTREEVLIGRGERTCGNKRCKNNCYDMDDLVTFEVPFSYEEHGERKKELVKLRLCVNCRPLLTHSTANRTSSTGITSPEKELEQEKTSRGNSRESVKTKKHKLKNLEWSYRKEKKRRRKNRT